MFFMKIKSKQTYGNPNAPDMMLSDRPNMLVSNRGVMDNSPTRRFVAGVSPTRRFAAERFADAALRRTPFRRRGGVSPTSR